MFELEALEQALQALGAVLRGRGKSYVLLVAGGSSLLLLGLADRSTADLDVVGQGVGGGYLKVDPLPPDLTEAVSDVGAALGLSPTWLNNGPTSLLDFGLPPGLESRVTVLRYDALELHVPSRTDMICFKLDAAVDQGTRSKHFFDLEALEPSREELLDAARWTTTHDPSPGFRVELFAMLKAFQVEVDDGDL